MCSFAGPARWQTFINHSSCLQTLHKTINYRIVYLHLPCHPSIAKTWLWHANSVPLLCWSQFSSNHNLAMKTLWKTLQPQLANTLCLIRYDTNCKPVLIEHNLIDRWCVTHLIKTYVYRYSLQQSHFKKVTLKKKIFMKKIKWRLTFVDVYMYILKFWCVLDLDVLLVLNYFVLVLKLIKVYFKRSKQWWCLL